MEDLGRINEIKKLITEIKDIELIELKKFQDKLEHLIDVFDDSEPNYSEFLKSQYQFLKEDIRMINDIRSRVIESIQFHIAPDELE